VGGRPITEAADPAEAVRLLALDMQQAAEKAAKPAKKKVKR